MKNFFKKLSFVLAIALVLTSLAPAGAAKAAAMEMNKKSATLYITENAKDTPDWIDLSVKNKPENWKSALDFEWASSNEDVATVGKAGVVTGVAAGTATISCTVTDKATDEVVAVATSKITVKANADKIEITGAPADGKVKIGEKVVNLNRTLYLDGVATTKRGVVVSNYTRWISSDTSIATVDKNGYVTVLKAGTVTITAEAYQSKANPETIVSASVKLTAEEEAGIASVAQTGSKVAKVTFKKAIAAADVNKIEVFQMVGTTPVKQIVKKATLDSTGKVATVELYVDFTTNAEYSFTFGEYKGGFVGAKLTVDEVAQIAVTTTSATVNKAAAIVVKLYDANGIEITDPNAAVRVTLNCVSDDCYFDGTSVTFFEAGKIATVEAVFHTYKYDSLGNETVLKAQGAIVSVNQMQATVNNVASFHVAKTPSWSSRNDKITVDDIGYKIFAEALKTDGTKIKNIADALITFESADPSKLIVSATGDLYPIVAGTTTIVVKYDGAPIGAVNVTVLEKAFVNTLTVNLAKNLISRAEKGEDSALLTITAKDQLGRTIPVTATPELLGNEGKATAALVLNAGKYTFTKDDFSADGLFSYKVTFGNQTKVFTISAKTPSPELPSTYKVELAGGKTSVDMGINLSNTNATTSVAITLVESKGGLKYDVVDIEYTSKAQAEAALSAITGAAVVKYYDITAPVGATVDGTSIKLFATDGTTITKAKTGSIKVTLFELSKAANGTFSAPKPLNTAYMTVTDNQAMPAVAVQTQQAASSAPTDIMACFKVNNKPSTDGSWTIANADIIGLAAGAGRVFVRNATFMTKVKGLEGTYTITVPVNQSIIIP